METTQLRAAVFARKSTDDEANVARQVQRGEEIIRDWGWVHGGTFTDNEASAGDVRQVAVRRLDERYADALQVGLFGYQRADGGVQDADAYRIFQHAAS